MATSVVERKSGAARDRREAQRLATREKLLTVSVEEFQRTGFSETDVARIAQRAGVSRGTFYFHFPAKEDVLAEITLREELRIAEEVAPRLRAGEALGEILRAVVAGILNAEGRLGPDLVRDMCALQLGPTVPEADNIAGHPLAELVLRAVVTVRPTRSPTVAQGLSDLAIIFLVGMFGLLATQSGRSGDRNRMIDRLITLTVKGATTP